MTGVYSDQSGTYLTTLTKAEWEAERERADEVHVVQHERAHGGGE